MNDSNAKRKPSTLTLTEVAEMLRVSEETVRGLIEKGEMPGAFKVGAQWRFNAERVEQMIAGQ